MARHRRAQPRVVTQALVWGVVGVGVAVVVLALTGASWRQVTALAAAGAVGAAVVYAAQRAGLLEVRELERLDDEHVGEIDDQEDLPRP